MTTGANANKSSILRETGRQIQIVKYRCGHKQVKQGVKNEGENKI